MARTSKRTKQLAALKEEAYTRDERYPFERLQKLQAWMYSVTDDMARSSKVGAK